MDRFLIQQGGIIRQIIQFKTNNEINTNNQYYRFDYDSQYNSLNRSTPMTKIRYDQESNFYKYK
ncbi:hypothetical protein BpHYR1_029875 [Brachionus plicatilis]|uniref:Uncharacterized protein n=1 Tax=Brachionus plicatilis TaxID=10195 RepID=A0A3M7SIU4_BRAPC|nr:hypothetical protein BpHYR1_029875 [Brachionus plicatilis]